MSVKDVINKLLWRAQLCYFQSELGLEIPHFKDLESSAAYLHLEGIMGRVTAVNYSTLEAINTNYKVSGHIRYTQDPPVASSVALSLSFVSSFPSQHPQVHL